MSNPYHFSSEQRAICEALLSVAAQGLQRNVAGLPIGEAIGDKISNHAFRALRDLLTAWGCDELLYECLTENYGGNGYGFEALLAAQDRVDEVREYQHQQRREKQLFSDGFVSYSYCIPEFGFCDFWVLNPEEFERGFEACLKMSATRRHLRSLRHGARVRYVKHVRECGAKGADFWRGQLEALKVRLAR